MECQTTDPISSNQVIEVGLRKVRCMDFDDNTLNDWLKWLADEVCCLKNDFETETIELQVLSNWDIYRQPKLHRQGNFYKISGEVGGGDMSTTIFNLPFTPSHTMVFPIAHEFTPSNLADFQPFIRIGVDRTVKLYFTGTAPTGASSKLYLDNISFFIE